MKKQYNHFQLTNREIDVLNILWSSKKPLLASEIAELGDSLSINTVQAILRKLLEKELIEVANIVYSGTVLSRNYQPTISSKDFILGKFVDQVDQFQKLDENITIPNIVAAFLEHEKNEEVVIGELEKLLQERKNLLNKD